MARYLGCLIMVLLAMLNVPGAALADQSGPHSLSDSKDDEINLNGLRDVGLALRLVRQQAVNIYLESTRMQVKINGSPDTVKPEKISDRTIDRSARYLPPRVEWLVYYVGTMEPIIHLLKEDLKILRGKDKWVYVPKGSEEKLKPLFNAWTRDVGELDEHLTAISDLIGKPDKNVEIAKESVDLIEVTDRLDQDRKRAFKIIQNAGANPALIAVPFQASEAD